MKTQCLKIGFKDLRNQTAQGKNHEKGREISLVLRYLVLLLRLLCAL